MAYRKWDIVIDEHHYTVELKTEGLGQRTILVDGVQQVQEKKLVNLGSVDRIKLGELGGQVEIGDTFSGVSYSLQMDRRDGNEEVPQVSVSYPQTERITCESDPAGVTLVYQNSASKTSSLLYALGLIVFGILLLTDVMKSLISWESPLFGIIVIFAGLGYGAYSYIKGINRSVFRVQRNELTVHQEPVPLPGSRKSLDPADLSQLIVRREIRIQKDSEGRNKGKEILFMLEAEMKSGGRQTLINNVKQFDDVVYLAQQVGNSLDLPTTREGDWS
jgi:hypothetical protein